MQIKESQKLPKHYETLQLLLLLLHRLLFVLLYNGLAPSCLALDMLRCPPGQKHLSPDQCITYSHFDSELHESRVITFVVLHSTRFCGKPKKPCKQQLRKIEGQEDKNARQLNDVRPGRAENEKPSCARALSKGLLHFVRSRPQEKSGEKKRSFQALKISMNLKKLTLSTFYFAFFEFRKAFGLRLSRPPPTTCSFCLSRQGFSFVNRAWALASALASALGLASVFPYVVHSLICIKP